MVKHLNIIPEMKFHSLFSLLVLFAAMYFLPGCSETVEMEELAEPCHTGFLTDNPISQELTCDPGLSFPLIVEGTSQVGTVRVIPVNGAFWVSYTTTGDWMIHKASIFADRAESIRTIDDCTPIFDPLAYTGALQTPAQNYQLAFYENSVADCFHFITTAEVSRSQDNDLETELAIANTGNRLSGNQHGWYGILCKSGCLTEINLPPDCQVFP